MGPRNSPNIGLVLTGGGARGAYQAGVMKGICEILDVQDAHPPFQILTGVSAGAVNAAIFAASAKHFRSGVENCCETWKNISIHSIVRTDLISIAHLSLRWMESLSLGNYFRKHRATFLLNAKPLEELLSKILDVDAISKNIDEGYLNGFATTSTNYHTRAAVTFYDAHPGILPWIRRSRFGLRSKLSLQQILASASIPILFTPIKIDGSYYGDGGVRLQTPLSPAIHLGAKRILAIGLRHPISISNGSQTSPAPLDARDVTLADIAGVLLDTLFTDSLDSDVERMERINTTLSLMTERQKQQNPNRLQNIPLLVIRPSQDLGLLAVNRFARFPAILRHFLSGLGVSQDRGTELLSYLGFDGSYTRVLVDLGYKDALNLRTGIMHFFGDKGGSKVGPKPRVASH